MEYTVEVFCFITLISFLFYKWATKNYKFFAIRNIAHEKPVFLIGNNLEFYKGKESIHELLIRQHIKFKKEKVYGYYALRNPYIFIRDPDLIKKIGIKDFDSFQNHADNKTLISDETIGCMLTSLQDQKWKDMRTTLTPVFTGNKMRQVFHIINECSCESVKYLKKTIKSQGTEIDLEDYFRRYSNDVIASAAFGLNINSFQDKENHFSKMGAVLLNGGGLGVVIKILILTLFPQISKIYKFRLFDETALGYLKGVVRQTIRQRQKDKIIRQDMIHLMLESVKQEVINAEEKTEANLTKWTETEMIAQCILFLFAGLGPMSNMLCSAAYELMKNPVIQEKLFEEIAQMNEDLNGTQISYELLKNMKYLDMVVSESLRKWPSVVFTDRVCSKSYTLTDADGKFVADFKPGDKILFPVLGSHYDEGNFQNPFTFDPERFSDENKSSIKPLTYIPFGVGPRSCIANRFGLMVGKIMLYHLILEYKLDSCPKSTPDIFAESRGLQFKKQEFYWMKLIPRCTHPVSS